jgi:hypothetical protein
MYFWRVEKCTFRGLIVVLFVFFFEKVVVIVGSKVVVLVGFCGTFRGFSVLVVVLVG